MESSRKSVLVYSCIELLFSLRPSLWNKWRKIKIICHLSNMAVLAHWASLGIKKEKSKECNEVTCCYLKSRYKSNFIFSFSVLSIQRLLCYTITILRTENTNFIKAYCNKFY